MKILRPEANTVDPDEGAYYELPGPEVIKLFSCSVQFSMKFFLLINVLKNANNCWHFNSYELEKIAF